MYKLKFNLFNFILEIKVDKHKNSAKRNTGSRYIF